MDMPVIEAIDFFKLASMSYDFDVLIKLGLKYLQLGQRLDSLSGGERQRLKLTKELNKSSEIIILDEPSTGLHPSDIQKLLLFFDSLLHKNNTLIVIEHNLDIIAQADWVIDIGPGVGKFGGNVVFEGTVQDLIKDNSSLTVQFLKNNYR